LSDDGWAALVDYGVTTIIDLRGDQERQEDPPYDVPVEVLHVPFMEADESAWKEIEERIEAAVLAAPDVTAATRDVYLIFLEHFKGNVAAGVQVGNNCNANVNQAGSGNVTAFVQACP
jgi:protein tyrosine/serine phosphatase